MSTGRDPLAALAELVRAEDDLLASTVRSHTRAGSAGTAEAHDPAADPALLVASGPRTSARADDYRLLVEAIREGLELHYRGGRVVCPEDPDLALLAGDRLYALGLALLAELGDVTAVAELADVISLASQAQADGDPALSDAIWSAGAASIAWGSTPAYREAKERARAGAPGARSALEAVVTARR